jgi:hypothetical protein
MSEDHEDSDEAKSSEIALLRAIEYAAKYRKGNEHKVFQTDLEEEQKLSVLQNQIKKSKQLVIKHVLQSRRLEHQYQQTQLTNTAIKTHLKEGKQAMRKKKKRSKLSLSDQELYQIDSLVGIISGSSSQLQRSLRLFNDHSLTKELESFPLEQLSVLNEHLFSKISWISSGKRISLSEAIQIFDFGSTFATILLRTTPQEPFDQIRWHVLKRMLRTRLRVIYLAEALSKYYQERSSLVIRASSASTSSLTRHSIHSSPETKSNTMSTTSLSHRKLLNSTSNSTPLFSSTLPSLQKQLSLSKNKQLSHSKKIQSNISLISQSVPLGSLSSATNYAKRVGVHKLTSVLSNKASGFLRLVFQKFKNEVKSSIFEKQVSQVQRFFGTHEFYAILQRASLEKMERYLFTWKRKLENLKELENYAAVIEIQRIGRGAIARFYVRNRHRIIASIHLQRGVRGWLGRKRVVVLKYERQLKWAVLVVESAWRKQRWVRMMRNLFALRKQTLATILLQRSYRGYRGRLEGQARRLLKKQNYGALKMQCLWRRYEAIVLVDEYYRRWKEIEGAITIQSGVRGMLGRKRVKRVRRWHESACVIQRAVRCRQARDFVYHLRRFIASRMIQKHWRGFQTKKRIQKILSVRRQAREHAENALNLIIKTVRGYWIRRKYGPRLQEFKAKRLEAMKRIKKRYQAVKKGNADRRMIQLWNHSAAVITRALRRFHELCSDRMRRKKLEYYSAVKIQSLVRGIQGRAYALEMQRLLAQAGEMKMPIYYRLRKRYYCDQNAFNGWAAIRIQCLIRRVIAKRVVMEMRWNHATKIIQKMVRKYLERKEAKEIVRQRKMALYYRDRMATRIQRIHRGILGRKLARIHRSSDILKWFLRETKMCGLPKRCFINFRSLTHSPPALLSPLRGLDLSFISNLLSLLSLPLSLSRLCFC